MHQPSQSKQQKHHQLQQQHKHRQRNHAQHASNLDQSDDKSKRDEFAAERSPISSAIQWLSSHFPSNESPAASPPPPLSIDLSQSQAVLLLNVLAFGYAATAVVVKLTQELRGGEGGAGDALVSAAGGAVEGFDLVTSGMGGLHVFGSLETSVEFAMRFVFASVGLGALTLAR